MANSKAMVRLIKRISVFLFVLLFSSFLFSQTVQTKDPEIAGEFFGIQVPTSNYYFAKNIISVFGTRWRGVPKTPEEIEKQVWIEILLSYEAFRRNIKVKDEEVDEEIGKMLKSHKVSFDWKKEPSAYAEWVKKTIGISVEIFRNQIEHLIKINKLRQEVIDSIQPTVSEKEVHQKFLDVYNTLSVELIQFDELEEAKDFYRKAKENPDFWKKEKEKNPKSFKQPGFVCLEFLMNMWGFHREDADQLIKLSPETLYPPAPIYKGYGVFQVLKVRPAEESDFSKQREYYEKQVSLQKKIAGFNEWLEDLEKRAKIKDYMKS